MCFQMQSMAKGAASDAARPAKLTVFSTLKYIYQQNGLKGLYRGVTPRIGLGVWQTICMVSFADYVKAWYVFTPSSSTLMVADGRCPGSLHSFIGFVERNIPPLSPLEYLIHIPAISMIDASHRWSSRKRKQTEF